MLLKATLPSVEDKKAFTCSLVNLLPLIFQISSSRLFMLFKSLSINSLINKAGETTLVPLYHFTSIKRDGLPLTKISIRGGFVALIFVNLYPLANLVPKPKQRAGEIFRNQHLIMLLVSDEFVPCCLFYTQAPPQYFHPKNHKNTKQIQKPTTLFYICQK